MSDETKLRFMSAIQCEHVCCKSCFADESIDMEVLGSGKVVRILVTVIIKMEKKHNL